MEKIYIEDKKFDQVDFTLDGLVKADYENCSFTNCNFSNQDLSKLSFAECDFTGCNFSLAKLATTAFNEVKFKDCKLLGLHFHDCHEFLFTVYFDNCLLNLSSFYKRKLKKTTFKNCTLHEVDFTQADLSGALFHNCDLSRATFQYAILEKADLRSSYNYSIDPEVNKIKKARFSAAGLAGLLEKYDIDIQ